MPRDEKAARIAATVQAWYRAEARTLPWRAVPGETPDPWGVLVSEVLLQQTRVATAEQAWPRLMASFPTPKVMAQAEEEAVLRAWAGLGYYRRARNLHAAAKTIVARHGGEVPATLAELAALPGVGPYTAAAVHAFAFDGLAAPLDANVARVMARLTGETRPLSSRAATEALEAATLAVLRHGAPRELGQAVMELGALVCTARAPACHACPLAAGLCDARATDRQDTLPVKRTKARPREERWAFALAVQRGAVLLERRGPGLLEGFWAPPGVQLTAGDPLAGEVLTARLRDLGVEARVGAASASGSWVFTHRVWRFAVHPARVRSRGAQAGRAEGPGGAALRWADADTLEALPLAKPLEPHVRAAVATRAGAAVAR